MLVKALAHVKHAAVLANFDLGLIDAVKKDAIVQACQDIEQGRLLDQFVVDVIQGGAGTSTNMNANEVIANRALEHLGLDKGEYSDDSPQRGREHGAVNQRRVSHRDQDRDHPGRHTSC